MTLKAMLVAYDDAEKGWPYPVGPREAAAQELATPSCATCRWARTTKEGDEDDAIDRNLARAGFPLRCELAEMVPLQFKQDGAVIMQSRLCVTMDGSEYRGDLYVKPDFGCVQWEGK